MSMYRESLALAIKLHTLILLAIVLDMALQVLKELDVLGGNASVASVIIWSLPAFFAHTHILFPDKAERDFNVSKISGFFIRNLGLVFLTLFPAILVVIAMYQDIQISADGDRDKAYILVSVFLLVPAAIAFLIVYGLLGTLLPAYITGRSRGIGKAMSRARKSFFVIVGRTIIGPAPIFLLSLFLAGLLPASLNVAPTYLLGEWAINTPFVLIVFAAFFLQGWAIVMMAWILSKAFLASEKSQKERQES